MDSNSKPAEVYRARVRQRRQNASRYALRLQRWSMFQRRCSVALVGYAVFDIAIVLFLVPVAFLIVATIGFQVGFLNRRLRRERRAVRHFERGLLRIEGGWIGDGDAGERYLREDELFADDLDLFGRGSLFQFVCTARTQVGADTLAEWLRNPAESAEIRERQDAVQELSEDVDILQRLAISELREGQLYPHALTRWSTAPPLFTGGLERWFGLMLAGALLVSLVAWIAFAQGTLVLLIIVILELLFYVLHRDRIRALSSDAYFAMTTMASLSVIGSQFRGQAFRSRRLSQITAEFAAERGVISRAAFFAYGFVGTFPILQSLLGQSVPQLERWRRRAGERAVRQLKSMGELEALASLAQFTYEQSNTVFPEIVGEVCFDAEELGHPLIAAEDRVTNSVCLGKDLRLLLVSGSNMSGKSTLLRTMGVNAALAFCGAPVCAAKLRISLLTVGTAMRFQDSLEHNTSHFFSVLRRLRSVLDLLERNERPLLFLIDEILQGTNSHDRLVGAEALIRRLVEDGAIGVVTTHDLELTRIVDGLGKRAANVHFADEVVDGEISFDYRMWPGVVKTSNALLLMRKMGMDV